MSVIKKDRAIVFASTSNNLFAIATVMLNLKSINPNIAEEFIIYLDNDAREKDKILINSIFPTKFIKYKLPIKSKPIYYSGAVAQFSKMVFAKYECLKLLSHYKNVLLLDYDIVILDDISDLFSHSPHAIKFMPGGCKVRDQLLNDCSDYNLELEGICASIFLFQDHLENHNELANFCYIETEKHALNLRMPEQAIFDFMIQRFNLQYNPISNYLYSSHPNDKLDHALPPKILHSYGQPKFWNGLENETWNKHYQQWLKMGGTPFAPTPKYSLLTRKIKRKLLELTDIF